MNTTIENAEQKTDNDLIMRLKPCPTDKSYYRFRMLAFNSDSKNDRDDPHIIRYVHQILNNDPKNEYPIVEDEVICSHTLHVHVEGDRNGSCPICNLVTKSCVNSLFGKMHTESHEKLKNLARKYQAIIPVYCVNDPVCEDNNDKFKVIIIDDENEYAKLQKKILTQMNMNNVSVFNGVEAVDLCIHVSEELNVFIDDNGNETTDTKIIWDKVVFSTKPYDITYITKDAFRNMKFDDTYYVSSTQDEISAFYDKWCK